MSLRSILWARGRSTHVGWCGTSPELVWTATRAWALLSSITLNKPAAKNEEGTHHGPKDGPCVITTSQVGLCRVAARTRNGLPFACHAQCTAEAPHAVQHNPALPRQAPPHAAAAVQGFLASCLPRSLLARPSSQAACHPGVVCVQHSTPLPSIMPLIPCTQALPWLYIHTKQPIGLLGCWPMRPW